MVANSWWSRRSWLAQLRSLAACDGVVFARHTIGNLESWPPSSWLLVVVVDPPPLVESRIVADSVRRISSSVWPKIRTRFSKVNHFPTEDDYSWARCTKQSSWFPDRRDSQSGGGISGKKKFPSKCYNRKSGNLISKNSYLSKAMRFHVFAQWTRISVAFRTVGHLTCVWLLRVDKIQSRLLLVGWFKSKNTELKCVRWCLARSEELLNALSQPSNGHW